MSSVRPFLVTESDSELNILNEKPKHEQEYRRSDTGELDVKTQPTLESDYGGEGFRNMAKASVSVNSTGSEATNKSDGTAFRKKSFRRLWSLVQERVSTFHMQQHTGDGLILALVRTRDQIFSDTYYTEDTTHEVLQLVLVLWLHAAALILQYGLTYHLYFTTVDGLETPFRSGVMEKMQAAILHAVSHEPPLALSAEDPIQKQALDLCVKQHSLGFTHLMVLSLWGARMVAEVSELLNSGTILSLISEPASQSASFLEEREEDGKMLIANMSLPMKWACILLVILPKLVCTSFLMWTGGKLFMLTHTMGSLIIPLLTLTYILQIPAILFTGFSSF